MRIPDVLEMNQCLVDRKKVEEFSRFFFISSMSLLTITWTCQLSNLWTGY